MKSADNSFDKHRRQRNTISEAYHEKERLKNLPFSA